jgi:hypothetical protein
MVKSIAGFSSDDVQQQENCCSFNDITALIANVFNPTFR